MAVFLTPESADGFPITARIIEPYQERADLEREVRKMERDVEGQDTKDCQVEKQKLAF